jgi:HD-like signal output (HDOD) protein
MTHNEHPLDLTGWIARIRNREMPVFSHTIESLRTILGDDRASASALAKVILMDAPMTSKVLRLANSAFFNHGRQGVSTVSRAIVVLGFNPVAELALSVSLIDSLLSGGLRGRVHAEMARSFHAAVQSRWVAQRRGEGGGEEVFIAALLARVGEMAFWCFGGEQAKSLDRCLLQSSIRDEAAQQIVLGFPLRQLSVGLVREWKLGSLVGAAIEQDPRSRGPERAVLLGQRLARAAEEGWDTPVGRQCLRDVAEYVGLPVAAMQAEILANAGEAARIARTFGAPDAAKMIPRSELPSEPLVPPLQSGPDAQLQLRILQDLGEMIMSRARIVDILQLVVEGVYRGAGCERVIIAFLTEDRLKLVGRVALGNGADALCGRFIFSMEGEPDDVLDAAIDSGQSCHIQVTGPDESGARRLIQVTVCDEGFLVPFGTSAQRIGVLYADRNGKPLDEEGCRAVRQFALQASLALEVEASSSLFR